MKSVALSRDQGSGQSRQELQKGATDLYNQLVFMQPDGGPPSPIPPEKKSVDLNSTNNTSAAPNPGMVATAGSTNAYPAPNLFALANASNTQKAGTLNTVKAPQVQSPNLASVFVDPHAKDKPKDNSEAPPALPPYNPQAASTAKTPTNSTANAKKTTAAPAPPIPPKPKGS